MAYAINSGAILQVTCKYALTSGPDVAMTTHHYRTSGGTYANGAQAALEVAQAFKSDAGKWGQLWRATASAFTALTGVDAQWIYPTRYQKQSDGLASIFGTNANPAAPPGTQVSIERRGDEANRHGVGGVRVPGLANNGTDSAGLLVVGQRPAFEALANFCDLSFSVPTNPAVTLSPVIFWRGNPPNSVAITQGILHLQIRTMRRRVVGRGI